LVFEFAEIIRRTRPIVDDGIVMGMEADAALLFLEASAWNVNEAMDSYLEARASPQPTATYLSIGRGGGGGQKATAAGGRSAPPASDSDELGDDIRWMEGRSVAVAVKEHSDPSLAAELRNLRVQTFNAEKDEVDADEEDDAGGESGEEGKMEGGEEDKLREERREGREQKGERIKATEDEKKDGDANEGKRDEDEDDDGQQVEELSPILVRGVLSDDTACQLEAMTQIRKLLCMCCTPSIDAERIMGLAPRFVEFLQRHENTPLQREAAHALGYITFGTRAQTQEVVELNAIPILVQLLGGSPDAGVRQEVTENVCYIAQTSSEYRDLLLDSNVLQPLLEQINNNNEDPTTEMLQIASLAIANLCRSDPPPEFETVAPALDTLVHLLSSSDDPGILENTCIAFCWLSEGHADKMQIEDDVCRRLVELLTHPSPGVQCPALRAVGHLVFVEGTQQRQETLDGSILPCLPSLLSSSDHGIVKSACWMYVKESYCTTVLIPQPDMLRLQP
jgi:hypothetical protein